MPMQGGTTYTFVTGGIEAGLEQGKAAAGERDVGIWGGANIIRQYLRAGLVDELQIHLVPVLLGEGVRLFEDGGRARIELERTRTIEAPAATHLRFEVVKGDRHGTATCHPGTPAIRGSSGSGGISDLRFSAPNPR